MPWSEEPDARIAHVRICGSRGRATTLGHPARPVSEAGEGIRQWNAGAPSGATGSVVSGGTPLGPRMASRLSTRAPASSRCPSNDPSCSSGSGQGTRSIAEPVFISPAAEPAHRCRWEAADGSCFGLAIHGETPQPRVTEDSLWSSTPARLDQRSRCRTLGTSRAGVRGKPVLRLVSDGREGPIIQG